MKTCQPVEFLLLPVWRSGVLDWEVMLNKSVDTWAFERARVAVMAVRHDLWKANLDFHMSREHL